MDKLRVKCWNGIHGCQAFEILMWEVSSSNIDEVIKHYKRIYGHAWIEDSKGNVYKSLKHYFSKIKMEV